MEKRRKKLFFFGFGKSLPYLFITRLLSLTRLNSVILRSLTIAIGAIKGIVWNLGRLPIRNHPKFSLDFPRNKLHVFTLNGDRRWRTASYLNGCDRQFNGECPRWPKSPARETLSKYILRDYLTIVLLFVFIFLSKTSWKHGKKQNKKQNNIRC